MNPFNRREFVFFSSGATFGNIAFQGLPESQDDGTQIDFSESGLVTGKPKPLKHDAIPGFLSAEQIAPHHSAHYGGALRGYNSADSRIEASIQTNTTLDGAAYGALKRMINSKGNSVVLHEMYFDGLAPQAASPDKHIRSAIVERFGSLEKWTNDFVESAKAAAGWAMLVKHPVNGKLYNIVSDQHAMGLLWMSVPMVVIDTYEHAFYIDYKNRKGDYVEKFIEHIDWNEVNLRFQSV